MVTRPEFIEFFLRGFTTLVFLFIGLMASVSYSSLTSQPTEDEKSKIEQILTQQAKCWNDKDIEGFMETYWNSQSLTFSSGGKTTRGWQATLDRYKTKYPPEKMGRLTFDHLETTVLGKNAALVLGKWHLKINDKNADGNFSLVLRQIDGKWKIIHDHSSSLEK